MPGCDHFEIAIEQRLHGALDPVGADPLVAHLSTCERCRAFEATARRTETAMRETADAALLGVDWAVVARGIGRWRRRRRLVAGVLAILAIVLATQLAGLLREPSGDDPEAPVALLVAAGALVALATAVVIRWRRDRRVLLAGPSRDTLALLRRDLARRARLLRVLDVALPIYAAACLAAAWSAADQPQKAGLFGGLALLAMVAWAAARFVKRPRLAREQAELDGAAGR